MTVVAKWVEGARSKSKKGDSGKEDYCGWWAEFRN